MSFEIMPSPCSRPSHRIQLDSTPREPSTWVLLRISWLKQDRHIVSILHRGHPLLSIPQKAYPIRTRYDSSKTVGSTRLGGVSAVPYLITKTHFLDGGPLLYCLYLNVTGDFLLTSSPYMFDKLSSIFPFSGLHVPCEDTNPYAA